VIPLQRIMPDALASVLRKAPLTPEKVAFAWRNAVGPAVDAVTSVELHEGVLRVRARDQAWTKEVQRSTALIQARLGMVLGVGVVRAIDVMTSDRPTPEAPPRPRRR
jgi:hypothetical protein